ncbi:MULTISPECIES: hypothetical protein [unclassified Caballeronia]|uniref:hypothetical protein n=1 Tax=unclassified Caballeronia TaxID=2646786 RepID=UPI002027EDB5|nr:MULTISPECIES: hypothetical protein [unclassified Caballeronia]
MKYLSWLPKLWIVDALCGFVEVANTAPGLIHGALTCDEVAQLNDQASASRRYFSTCDLQHRDLFVTVEHARPASAIGPDRSASLDDATLYGAGATYMQRVGFGVGSCALTALGYSAPSAIHPRENEP